MASLLDSILNQGTSYGTYNAPQKVTSPIAGVQSIQSQANTAPAYTADPYNITAPAGSGPVNTDPQEYLPTSGSHDPTKLSQNQRQSLWAANGHAGIAPDGYGGEGGSNAQDPAAIANAKMKDAVATAQSQYATGVANYDKANPFSMSDMLAKEANNVKDSISPYYAQQLTNYMQGVDNLRGNTIQDEQRLLTKLQGDYDAYTGQAKKTLATTLVQAGQQYSDAGSYDSGARMRTQGTDEADTAYGIQQATRQNAYDQGSAQLQANRFVNQQQPLETTMFTQNQARDQLAATNLGAAQNYNYDLSMNKYKEAQAGVAKVQGGDLQTAGAMPGMTSIDTAAKLSSMLPNVQGNMSTPLYQNYTAQ